jgi:hypothetical protein
VPRRFGYIIVAAAVVLGVGTLLLPLPEQVEVKAPEVTPAAKTPRPPTAPAVPSRAARKPAAQLPPAAPPKVPLVPPAARAPFPMQDTTKTRTLVQPQSAEPKE